MNPTRRFGARGIFVLLLALLLCACVAEGVDQSPAESFLTSEAESQPLWESMDEDAQSRHEESGKEPDHSTVPSEDTESDTESQTESDTESETEEPSEDTSDEPPSKDPHEPSEDPDDPPEEPDDPPEEPDDPSGMLQLVAKFDVGMGEMFEYAICCSRTAKPAEILTPIIHGTDGDGNVYVFWNLSVIRLNDGKKLSYTSHYTEAQMLFAEDALYLMFTDNSVQKFSMENGFENAVLTDTYTLTAKDGQTGSLLHTEAGVLWLDANGKTFSLDGKQVSVPLPETAGELKWLNANGYAAAENQFTTRNDFIIESLYTAYDKDGNAVSRFLMRETQDGTIHGYNMLYKYGKIKYYYGWEVQIGETVFEKAVNATLVYGNGEVYAVVYFPEHGEIYRITPTLQEVSLSKFKEKSPTMKDPGIFLNISRSKTKANVLEMLEVIWTVRSEHLDPTYETVIPEYLKDAVGQEVMGIPYCRGGYNGHSYFGKDSFASCVETMLFDDFYYTTGNVNPDVGHQHFTIGLDCSAFVCAAWEFVDSGSGTDEPFHWSNPPYLTKYGHEVSSVYDLKEMDILIRPGDNAHVMFFACLGPNNTIGVYEVTSLILPEKTVFRYIDISRLKDYTYLHPYQSYGCDENGHWSQCDSCHKAIDESTPHTYKNGLCTVCGYKK